MAADAAPEEFFIFVSRASFWTRHNFGVTGSFVSGGFAAANPDAVPVGTVTLWGPGSEAPQGDAVRAAYEDGSLDYTMFAPNPAYFGWPTPFAAEIVADYRVEWDAEAARRLHYPRLPSRLSAVYAFADWPTCEAVSAKHHWSLAQVERFRLIPDPLNRVVQVNMEIVSLARTSYRRGSWTPAEIDSLWRSYWSGAGNVALDLPVDGVNFERIESGVISEYLIEGRLDRVSP